MVTVDVADEPVRLRQCEQVPEGFLQAQAHELESLLGGPTLIHLRGRRGPPLFLSTLLHGNETTGFEALQQLLRRDTPLARDLSIFVGNVTAASHGVRRLEGQADYNRVWPGTEQAPGAEARLMTEVVDVMRQRQVFASIDIHNNTGLNPHYACVNRIEAPFLQLATLFSRTVVYFTRPVGVQSAAFADLCPAVTVECGQSGQAHSTRHALEFIDACLHLSEVPSQPVAEHDLALFHTVATVKVPSAVSFSFSRADTDILFDRDLDHFNFRELRAGTRLGRLRPGSQVSLQALDNQGRDVAGDYFQVHNNELHLARDLMPSMLTLDERVIRQDCLCYLMERVPASQVRRSQE